MIKNENIFVLCLKNDIVFCDLRRFKCLGIKRIEWSVKIENKGEFERCRRILDLCYMYGRTVALGCKIVKRIIKK